MGMIDGERDGGVDGVGVSKPTYVVAVKSISEHNSCDDTYRDFSSLFSGLKIYAELINLLLDK